MTDQPDPSTGDARQIDRLDAFLDGLAHGDPHPPPDLDPSLAATVRHVHALGRESVAADTQRAGKAQRWEDLMHRQVARSAVTPFPLATTTPTSFAPLPVPLRPTAAPSRLRRWGGRSLGLVATLTLVLLVAASGLAVYLSAPQGGDDPTMLPAAFGATPEATNQAGSQNPRVLIGSCDVEAMSFDELMGVLAASSENGTPPPNTSPLELPLPDGAPVDRSTQESLTLLTGNYIGCWTSLEMAALSTDDGIYRLFTSTEYHPGRADFSFLSGDLVVQAWQHRAAVRSYNPSFIGQPGPFALTELRQLGDGRVAGYLSRSDTLDTDGTHIGDDGGYIVFAQQDGKWLIDDFRPAPTG